MKRQWDGDLSKAKWVAALYCWRVKGGWAKRVIQPAIVEAIDGSRVTIDVVPYDTAADVRAHVKRIVQFYRKDMPKESRLSERKPLTPRVLSVELPSDTPGLGPLVSVKLTSDQARRLRELLDTLLPPKP